MALTDKLIAIGDAIRAKTGTTDTMTLTQMPELINGIKTGEGGGFPSEFTFIETDVNRNMMSPIAYGPEYLCCYQGTIYTSVNGRQWSSSTTTVSNLVLIAAINGVWYGYVSNDGVYYSNDFGATWTKTYLPSGGSYGVCESNGILYCYVSGSTNTTYYSYDGKTWSLISGVGGIKRVEYKDGVYMATPTGNFPGYRSTDGITWTSIDTLGTSGPSIVWHKGRWFGFCYGGPYYSEDGGETWTKPTGESGIREGVTNGNVMLGIASDSAGGGLYRSLDGLTWSHCMSGFYSGGTTMRYMNGIMFVSNYNKLIYSSDLGETWSEITPPTTHPKIGSVLYDGRTMFIHCGTSSSIYSWFYCPILG
jgi:hypothetical protein